jgi:DNA polymerase-1
MAQIPCNPFILVDGSSYLFRAFHALPPLTNSKGQPTGAIYGVVNMLRRLLNDYHPSHMVVIFDSKEKNFRHALFHEYKANRSVMPDELQQQLEPLYGLIQSLGIPLVIVPGIEADDIIGTLARQAKKRGLFTLISTGDKDFAQIVDDKTVLINTMSGDILDRGRVIEKFEVPPEQIIDYLALIGDTVDNVPGVPKVGPKTAVKWLETYGSLEEIVHNAEKITGKIGENLRGTLDKLPLYKKLVTIDTEIVFPFELDNFSLKAADNSSLEKWFAELEFKTWLRDLKGHEGNTPLAEASSVIPANPIKETAYDIILTEADFKQWLEKLENAELFAFDLETTSLDYMNAEIVGISFAVAPSVAAYVPVAHDYLGAPQQLSRDWVLEALRPLLEEEKRKKIGHNIKYDLEVLANYGIALQGIAFDTMLESYVLNSTASRHDMDSLAERHLNYKTITYEEVTGKGSKQITFNEVALEHAGFYAAEDADITLRLHLNLWPKFNKINSLKRVFETLEMPLVPVLAQMERTGVLIDVEMLKAQSEVLAIRLEALEEAAYAIAGKRFVLNSPKQLQEILFTELKMPIIEKTPTGQPSTSESVLQELAAEDFPLPKIILEYRSLSKLKSTYTEKLPLQVNHNTGRVHTSYHQAITTTGRLSSSNPNLQNIPVRTEEGRKIRSAFIASPGYKIAAFDYSQIELRILAHLSKDAGLLHAFSAGDDIHRSTASMVFGVKLAEVTAEQRRRAKAINFGLMYGMSAFGLARQLSVSQKEAEEHMKEYFNCFPGVKAFMESIRQQALEQGYVETLFGRRLYLPDLQAKNMARRKAAERAAVNAPMQGTNADIIKRAMINLQKWINENNLEIKMIMQVHDELVFEIKEALIETAVPEIRNRMETIATLSVKLQVGVGVGNNWDEAH